MTERPLTYRQARFIEEYLKDPSPNPNGSAAARRAGYSPNASKEQAYELLTTPKIIEKIEEANEAAAARLGITKERIMQELRDIGLANLKHIVVQDDDGNTDVRLAHLPDHIASALTGLSVTNKKGKRDVKINMADKQAALVTLMKMLGWFKDKVEVSGSLSLEQLIEASMDETETPAA